MLKQFKNPEVKKVFDAYPQKLKPKLLHLRQLILDTASETEGVGQLEETLKWGQPSYLTPISKSGTTIRIDQIKSNPEQYGIFVHCQTTLISTYREMYSDVLSFDGNRCVTLDLNEDPSDEVLRHCFELALTYHQKKKK